MLDKKIPDSIGKVIYLGAEYGEDTIAYRNVRHPEAKGVCYYKHRETRHDGKRIWDLTIYGDEVSEEDKEFMVKYGCAIEELLHFDRRVVSNALLDVDGEELLGLKLEKPVCEYSGIGMR